MDRYVMVDMVGKKELILRREKWLERDPGSEKRRGLKG